MTTEPHGSVKQDTSTVGGPARQNDGLPTAGPFLEPSIWAVRHGPYLLRFALQRVRDLDLAEDLVQETYLAALEGRAAFSGKSSERTWLTAILRHKSIDAFRRRRRMELRETRPDGVTEVASDRARRSARILNQSNAGRDPSTLLALKQLWKLLEAGLAQLPRRTAAAFSLREIEGLSTAEVCQKLKVTPDHLNVLIYRARRRLKKTLAGAYLDDTDKRLLRTGTRQGPRKAMTRSRQASRLPRPTFLAGMNARPTGGRRARPANRHTGGLRFAQNVPGSPFRRRHQAIRISAVGSVVAESSQRSRAGIKRVANG